MTSKTAPAAPRGLSTAGRRLWRSVADDYELTVAEELTLIEACRVADRLDRLAKESAGQPLTIENGKGDQVTHPLIVEARQQSIVFTRLVAALRLPTEPGEEQGRPQHRGTPRGAYEPRPLHVAGSPA